MGRRTVSQLFVILMTVLTASNATLRLPRFFSSGFFGSKNSTAEIDSFNTTSLIDPLPAASSPLGQVTTIDFGSGTANSFRAQSGGSAQPSNGGQRPTHGAPDYSNYQGQQSHGRSPILSQPQYGGSPSYSTRYQPQPQAQLPPNGGSQFSHSSTPYRAPQFYGGPIPQKPTSQSNVYPSAALPQSNSPGMSPYNPNLSSPLATYSPGVSTFHSGNTKPYLTPAPYASQYNKPGHIVDTIEATKEVSNRFNVKNTTKKGAFTWRSPDGELYEISYTAEALPTNFEGTHTPPQIRHQDPTLRTLTEEALNPFGISFETSPTVSSTVLPLPSKIETLPAQVPVLPETFTPNPVKSYVTKKPHSRFPVPNFSAFNIGN